MRRSCSHDESRRTQVDDLDRSCADRPRAASVIPPEMQVRNGFGRHKGLGTGVEAHRDRRPINLGGDGQEIICIVERKGCLLFHAAALRKAGCSICKNEPEESNAIEEMLHRFGERRAVCLSPKHQITLRKLFVLPTAKSTFDLSLEQPAPSDRR